SRPPLVLLEGRGEIAGNEQLLPSQGIGGPAVLAALEAEDRPRLESGPSRDASRPATHLDDVAGREQVRDRVGYVKASVQSMRAPDPPRLQPVVGLAQASTMSTNTRRRSLAAAAFITARRAPAVRPPRPITLP
ncbi:MAG: hypothetical protein QOF83_537, partial [Solirubrobacteraceae bacterium]|nr:hypothetical protein [Solirubrobacteraceae bacterium]